MKKTLKFRKELIPLILSGEKNSTWRIFDEKNLQEGDEIVLINWETKEKFADAIITSIREKELGEIEKSDFDGHKKFESPEKLLKTYKSYYGDKVNFQTPVKMIIFSLKNNSRPGGKKYSIGVFDSGFGGLQILRHIVKALPQYNYIYLGDTARIPYGSRSQEVILKFTTQAADFLFNKNCRLIIFACNTASSKALKKLQQEYLPKKYPQRRILGVIIPAIEEAAKKSRGRVGVIATEGSVNSGVFIKEMGKINPRTKIFQQACPLLVPIVEAGEDRSAAADLILKNYLRPLLGQKMDTLILGCTHYGILENKIKKFAGNKIKIINEGRVAAKKLKDYLAGHPEIERILAKQSQTRFFTTDLTDNFEKLGSRFFGQKIRPEKIELE